MRLCSGITRPLVRARVGKQGNTSALLHTALTLRHAYELAMLDESCSYRIRNSCRSGKEVHMRHGVRLRSGGRPPVVLDNNICCVTHCRVFASRRIRSVPTKISKRQDSAAISRIPWQALLPLRLGPDKTLRYLDCSFLQPILNSVPINSFLHSVGVRSRILMVKHPVVCDECGIEVAHKTLPDVVHAVFVVSLVHIRNLLDLLLHFFEI